MANLAPVKIEAAPARVSVRLGYKRNMGNYETLNMEIEVEDSARADEKVSDTFTRVFKFVEDRLVEKMNDVEESLKNQEG